MKLNMAPPALKPFQLLEINVISAQDLEPVSKKMKAYATAWVNPKRKLISRVDSSGNVNPTWNDKFVFRVDDEFLSQDTSAVHIEIYSVHWFKDALVGSVRVLVGNLIPPLLRSRQNNHVGMRFVALQIRRPSGRPQGILNIGVTLLDSSMRSMPLYAQIATSAVGYHGLAGEDDSYLQKITENNNTKGNKGGNASNVKPILRRSRSERSVALDMNSVGGSVVGIPQKMRAAALEKDNSIISISNEPFKGFPNKGKASSVINGAEFRDKNPNGRRRRSGKAGSILSESGVSKESSLVRPKMDANAKPISPNAAPAGDPKLKGPNEKDAEEKFVPVPKTVSPQPQVMAIGKPVANYGGPRGNNKNAFGAPYKGNSIWSDSEVGPSPSEVAAVMAQRRYPLEEADGSVLDGWSLDESVEGLKSKLERWRTELPPLYDADYTSSSFRSRSTATNHKRRHTEGSGLFSCFGNICGYECQCICGKPTERKNINGQYRSPSISGSYF